MAPMLAVVRMLPVAECGCDSVVGIETMGVDGPYNKVSTIKTSGSRGV
jgi:hypothetical protein